MKGQVKGFRVWRTDCGHDQQLVFGDKFVFSHVRAGVKSEELRKLHSLLSKSVGPWREAFCPTSQKQCWEHCTTTEYSTSEKL